MRQLFYYKMVQLLQIATILLQIATVINNKCETKNLLDLGAPVNFSRFI